MNLGTFTKITVNLGAKFRSDQAYRIKLPAEADLVYQQFLII